MVRNYLGPLGCTTKFKTEALLVPTVKHTGTHYIMRVLGYNYAKLLRDGKVCIKKKPCTKHLHTYDIINGHFDERADTLIEMSKHMRTVIPLRHPAFVAVSWKKRPTDINHRGTFLDEWLKMCEVDNAFHFPLETMPFDKLAEFTGMELNRTKQRIHSIGDYPQRKDLQTARNFLQDEWALVEQALDTSIGRKFYHDNSIHRVRP